MPPEDRVRLLHMIEAAETALDFVSGRRREDLDSDRKLLFALVRAIEIIGEAAGRISESVRSTAPDVPWPLIVSMRNRLIPRLLRRQSGHSLEHGHYRTP